LARPKGRANRNATTVSSEKTIKIISRLRTRKSATLAPVFCL
jgi:hypothetical protein